ncbi:MAG: hypothetical protein JWQ44_2853 [Chthoniobacter sp.]|nr:hypothetical protein [Chthoniobacter sp.]
MVTHPVILRGYHASRNDRLAAPVLVKRLDQEFIPGVLDGLRRKLAPTDLGEAKSAEDFRGNHLRLFQPVHRTFNLVLLEAVCDRPGFPRLNPRDIASAGFVIRREAEGRNEGWLLRDDQVIGWENVDAPTLDPDAKHRRPRLNAGHPHVNGKLARLYEALEPPAERVAPLFVAPPEVCAEAERTLLYGLVPVTSSERSEKPQPVAIDADVLQASMPNFLRGPGAWPELGKDPVTFQLVNDLVATDPNHPLTRLMQNLRLMHFGWHAFAAGTGNAILPLLNEVNVAYSDGPEPLGDFLQRLLRRFVLREDGEAAIPMPDDWPLPTDALAARIRAQAGKNLADRLNEGVPNQQRFEEPGAVYRLHAFARVRGADGCPPELHWSQPSRTFHIVPWWESGGAPLHTISLPDFDRESVKNIKPNVAFKIPPRLAALLNQSPRNFLDGKAEPQGLGIAWICSFSIPIITLCAFIVMFIFLVLLHVAFWWLFYIKICLPFPKKQ